MADPRFFPRPEPVSLAAIAERTGARPAPGCDLAALVDGAAPLHLAGAGDLSFAEGARHLPALLASAAGAVLITADLAPEAAGRANLLIVPAPRLAYARLTAWLYPDVAGPAGVHAGASIDPTAEIGAGCRIEPGAIIGAGASIGPDCTIGAQAVIGPGVVLGPQCRIGAHVTISHAVIGAGVRLHPGVRIGQPGFGFVPGPQGPEPMPQLGCVRIGDGCEIGANTTIDRGTGDDTVIGPDCKIDNLVQIGHNCRLGRGCILAGQAGLSGSVIMGDHVMVGGAAGIKDHVRIGDRARIAAQAGVMRDVPPGARIMGTPARDARQFLREYLLLGRLGGRTS